MAARPTTQALCAGSRAWLGVTEPAARTCIVFHAPTHPDGLANDGFVTSIEACRAYRDLYPGVVECVGDREWTVVH